MPFINIDGVPEELRTTEDFQRNYNRMLRELENPEFVETLCAHEAAHIVYHAMMEPFTYEPLCSRLEFNTERNRYEGHFAAIKPVNPPLCHPHQWQTWLLMWSDAAVAGGVVARRLMPESTGGDEGDKRIFVADCAGLARQFGLSIDADFVWNEAQKRVRRQLENKPEILEKILELAKELRPRFGL